MQSVASEVKRLCTPALVYLVFSILFIITAMVQNAGNTNKVCIGRVECNVQSTSATFLINILWVVFWTWILSSLCKYGHSNIAWFLVLLPFIMVFVMLVMFADMVSGNERAMKALLEETSRDISNQQLSSDAALNMRLQSGYLESGNQFTGVKVYHL
jgi:uncharacterized protein YacL